MDGPGNRTGARAIVALVSVLALLALHAAPASANHQPPNLTLQPERDTNTVGEQHCVTARLRETGHGSPPIAGATIRFSVSGANTAAGAAVTAANGTATFCYTGTKAGDDVITAFADLDNDGQRDAGEPLATAAKTYLPGPTTTVTLSPAAAINTVGEPHCVTATATDQFGNPTPGVPLLFSVTGANAASGTRTTGTTGQATFCYTGQNAGPDAIRVTADVNRDGVAALTEPTALASKLYRPAGPSALTLTPAAAANPTGQPHCVTATATNLTGQPSAGVRIVFSVSGANPRPPTTRTTDSNGQATFCYTGTNVGLDVITAFADTNANGAQDVGELVATATKSYVPGAPATVVVTPPTAENTVGTQHCVSASVEDAFGNPVPDATVFFTVSGANSRTATAKTDVNGNATFCYTGTQAGLDTIVAVADADGDNQSEATDPRGTATKLYHPGIPATVTVSPPAAVNEAGVQHCVTATVHDQFGNLVGPGHTVIFSVTGANPRGPETRTTDASGQATFCYTGTQAGEDVIRAVADTDGNGQADAGEPTGVATKTYRPGPPATLELEPKAATNTVGEQHCVTATVTDAFGNPNQGVTVRFFVTGSIMTGDDGVELGASGSDTTDAQGTAEFCYTSELPGENVITAYADTDRSGTQDPGEPADVATKTYVVPITSPLCDIAINDGGWIVTLSGDKGTFGGNAKTDSGGRVVSGSQEYTDHGPVASLNAKSAQILAVVCEGNRATVFGTARVEAALPYPAGTHAFRVRVMDSGEPGRADTYSVLLSNAYWSGDERPLQGGNVQVRTGG